VKHPIENTIFSKFVVGTANLALKWKDSPNITQIAVLLGGSSHFRQDLLHKILKIWYFQWGVSHMSNFHKNILL
jgi:hypothetical protein